MNISDISTKIIATVGPASQSKDIMTEMILSGVNIFRLNFSHGTYDEHKAYIRQIRLLSKELDISIGILQDICGPKIRIKTVDGKVILKPGDILFFSKEDIVLTDENKTASMSYPNIIDTLNVGDIFYIADGKVRVQVIEKGEFLKTEVHTEGIISSHKGLNFPNINIPVPIITEKDKKDIAFGIQEGVDFIALSFVSDAQNILEAKALLGEVDIPIIAKIEKPQAMQNLDEILEVADAIMVARGDLSVEVGFERVPVLQKEMIYKAKSRGVPVIIATQMLLSMVQSSTATRAEISDIAGAVYDQVDALMLSDETTIGSFPKLAVQSLYKTAQSVFEAQKFEPMSLYFSQNHYEAIAKSAVSLAYHLKAEAIISFSHTGSSIKYLSQYRPFCPIWALTTNERVLNRLTLLWGVRKGFVLPFKDRLEQKMEYFINMGLESKLLDKTKTYIVTVGHAKGMGVNTIFTLGPNEIEYYQNTSL